MAECQFVTESCLTLRCENQAVGSTGKTVGGTTVQMYTALDNSLEVTHCRVTTTWLLLSFLEKARRRQWNVGSESPSFYQGF